MARQLADRQLCAQLEKRLTNGAAMLDAEARTSPHSEEFYVLEHQFVRLLNTYEAASLRVQGVA